MTQPLFQPRHALGTDRQKQIRARRRRGEMIGGHQSVGEEAFQSRYAARNANDPNTWKCVSIDHC